MTHETEAGSAGSEAARWPNTVDFWAGPVGPNERRVARRQTLLFLLLTFAITWGIGALALVAPTILLGGQGDNGWRREVFFFIAVFAPSVSALILTFSALGLGPGLRTIGAGIIAPGRPLKLLLWVVVALAIVPASWLLTWALGFVGSAGQSIGQADATGLFVTTPLMLVTSFYILQDPGPLGEELGWRGYLLPRLLCLTDPIRASILVGLIWGLWHLPAFFVSSTAQSGNVFLFQLGNWIGWSILTTWVFIRMRGNWIVPGVLSHAYVNAALSEGGGAAIDIVYGMGALIGAVLLILWRGPLLDLKRNKKE